MSPVSAQHHKIKWSQTHSLTCEGREVLIKHSCSLNVSSVYFYCTFFYHYFEGLQLHSVNSSLSELAHNW